MADDADTAIRLLRIERAQSELRLLLIEILQRLQLAHIGDPPRKVNPPDDGN